jgi:hypothetical protein
MRLVSRRLWNVAALAPVLLLSSLGTLSSSCAPPCNPYDPGAPLDCQVGYTLTGRILTRLNLDLVPPPPGLIRIQVDGQLVEVALAGQNGEDVDEAQLGAFTLELDPGPHEIRFLDVSDQTRIDTGYEVLNVEGGPGETVSVHTRVDQATPYIYMKDRVAPGPFLVEAIAPITNELSLTVVAIHSANGEPLAQDPQGNLTHYQFRTSLGGWSEPQPVDDDAWTTTALQENGITEIEWRAIDFDGNVGTTNRSFIRHDDLDPVSPEPLVVDAGNGRIDLSWTPDPDPGVRYRIDYGPTETFLQGTNANEGPSGIITFSNQFRLTGLPNGTPVWVRVVAIDEADNALPTTIQPALPNTVTPELIDRQNITAGDALAWTMLGDLAFVLVDAAEPEVVLFDVGGATHDGGIEQIATLPATDNAQDLAAYGSALVLATGTDTVRIYDLRDLGDITFTDVPLTDALPDCATFNCDAVAVAAHAGWAYIAVRAAEPHVGGVVAFDITDPSSPVPADDDHDPNNGIQPLHIDLDRTRTVAPDDQFNDKLVGPLRVFGRFLAVGFETNVNNNIVGGTVPTTRGVLVGWRNPNDPDERGACFAIEPTIGGTRQEVFVGDGIENPEQDQLSGLKQRAVFEVYGDYLTVGYDAWVSTHRIGGAGAETALENGCSGAVATPALPSAIDLPVRTTDELTVGTHNLGLAHSASAVQQVGGYLMVGSVSRNFLFAPDPQIEILSTATRQTTPGQEVAFQPVGRMATQAIGRIAFDGVTATLVGPNAIEVWEIFEPESPELIAVVGENPTGQNVGFGNYVLHQRTLRGIGVWDLANPTLPVLENDSTCVPGCFIETELAGAPLLDGGWLISGMTGEPSLPLGNGNRALNIVEVTQPRQLRTVATFDNPCADTRARGFAALPPYAFITCEKTDALVAINLADAHNADDFALAAAETLTLPSLGGTNEPTHGRALAAARAGADRRAGVYMLTSLGALAFFPADADGTLDVATVEETLTPAELDIGFGEALAVANNELYILGGSSADGCDPYLVGDSCEVIDHVLSVFDLRTELLTDRRKKVVSTVTEQPDGTDVAIDNDRRMSLEAHPGLLILGRSSAGNRYELYRHDDFRGPRAIAGPNALPLTATVVGGHLVTADMRVYALE